MDVSADSDLLVVFDWVLHKRIISRKDVLAFFHELESVTLVQSLLILEVFHQFDDPAYAKQYQAEVTSSFSSSLGPV